MRLTYFIFISYLLVASCSPTWRQKLSMPRTDYTGQELKTDGFYYNKNFGSFILYRNGVYLGGFSGVMGVNSVEGLHNFWQNPRFLSDCKKYPADWGVFQVQNNTINIEKWFERNAGEAAPTARIIGKILNDSTVVITESFFPPQHTIKSDTFHFYPMLLKPDSTNAFIK